MESLGLNCEDRLLVRGISLIGFEKGGERRQRNERKRWHRQEKEELTR